MHSAHDTAVAIEKMPLECILIIHNRQYHIVSQSCVGGWEQERWRALPAVSLLQKGVRGIRTARNHEAASHQDAAMCRVYVRRNSTRPFVGGVG